MKYLFYTIDGKKEEIVTKKPLSLRKLQNLVGGYIEFVEGIDKHFCVNEEGKIKKLPVNQNYPKLVGNVIVGRMVNGNFFGIQ